MVFEEELNKYLTENGFKNKGQCWSIETTGYYFLIEKQNSKFDSNYYLNFGFYFKNLVEKKFTFKSTSLHLLGRFLPFISNNDNSLNNGGSEKKNKEMLEKFKTDVLLTIKLVDNFDKKLITQIQRFEIFWPQNYKAERIISAWEEWFTTKSEKN